MSVAAGCRLGPYEIESALGAGGMGEVYRARDTRLERTVAIKILNSQLTATPELRARFEREAKIISQLQHPHICVLHDIGSENGTDFLVMEFLEGESLADRLKRGALPIAELLRIAIQIADALDKAHRAGIVHRDLKPANVMLTKSGAKLLDFGLAKPLSANMTGGSNGTTQPGLTGALTQMPPAMAVSAVGSVLGTLQYMAPEQVQGLATDARSDIFSFGVMLFEMATGNCAFIGKTPASVVRQILAVDPPPVSTLQPGIPPMLGRAIQICLEKEPDERFQSAHDLKLQLQMIAEKSEGDVAGARPASRLGAIALAATALVALVAVAAAIYFNRSGAKPQAVLRSSLLPPENSSFSGTPALSPDGAKLAFVALDDKGAATLYVRSMDSFTSQPLAGTQGAELPFWSPDSQNIGFFADEKLKRLDLSGGPVETLADAQGARGGSWGSNGIILFSANMEGRVTIRLIPANGGTVTTISALKTGDKTHSGETSHQWPYLLPDGSHYLFWAEPQDAVCVGQVGSFDHKVLFEGTSDAIFANGYLLFLRDQTLMAQPFSLSKLATSGDAVPVAENVVNIPTVGPHGVFTASQSGLLVFMGGQFAAGWPLSWYNRDGKLSGTLGELARYSGPAISPDGQHVAVNKIVSYHNRGDVWILDTNRNTGVRLTFEERNAFPIWTADGKKIIYLGSAPSNHEVLKIKPADNSGPEQTLVADIGRVSWPTVSADGRYVAFMYASESTGWDIYAVDLQRDRKPFPVVHSPFTEITPSLSPDGKWLAYGSNENGKAQVYITAFPGGGMRWQVSSEGGAESRWRGDGKELFFSTSQGSIMAVDVSTNGDAVKLGTPHLLFRANMQPGPLGQFDVTRDGKRFLLNSLNAQGENNPLTLVTNWTAQLGR